MKTQETGRGRLQRNLVEMGEVLKGLAEELRVQAHLGAMEAKQDAEPYLETVSQATHDFIERGKALQVQLKKVREDHRA